MRRSLVTVVVVIAAVIGSLGAVFATDTSPQLGLDLQGGLSVVLAPKQEVSSDRLDKALEIVRNRIDALGVVEPEIARQGNTIVVDLPGVDEADRARDLIGTTAELQFRPVLGTVPLTGVTDPSTEPGTTDTSVPEPTTTVVEEGSGGNDEESLGGDGDRAVLGQADEATTTTEAPTPTTVPATEAEPGEPTPADEPIQAPDREGELLYQLGPAEVTGRAVDTARAEFQNEWQVIVEFTSQGSAEWDAMAARYVGQPVAIVLDGVVQSAPVIREARFGGSASITGNFSEGEAKDLALVLRFGALPVELEEISVNDVSPTLGRDQLDAGIVAGLAGLALVAVWVLLYYRILGVVVLASLAVTAGAIYALVSWLSATVGLTLTLAGVVGLIVSIGVAADSNIVYFERLKEELRAGRTVRSAADRAFKSAFRTIVAADIVTLLAAVLLWLLAIGAVRGFAFYLGLATLLDLFVAYFFMHPLVVVIGRNRRLAESRWFGISQLSTPPAEASA